MELDQAFATVVLVLMGAAILFLSGLKIHKILDLIRGDRFYLNWKKLHLLVGVFIAGYAGIAVLIYTPFKTLHSLVMGGIFLFGALFVLLVVQSGHDTIKDLIETRKKQADLIKSYGRFVPSEFLLKLNKKEITDIELGDNVLQDMTILFTDIRSFTTLSEQMTPEENFRFVNSYFRHMGPLVRQNGGFVDKYIGDGIMALFPQSAENAVDAGIAMLERLIAYNEKRRKSGYSSIRVGIGINTGSLMLGTIGEENRMEGTVISDNVNLASRIEGLTKTYGTPLLISEASYQALKDPGKYAIRFIDRVKVKGKSKQVTVYEVFNSDPTTVKELKIAGTKTFEKACLHFHENEFDLALAMFENCLKENPQDLVAEIYVERCHKRMAV
ncbi:MAG: hypothetical protein HQM13_13755 [SAR324 cluster bacterium]|nr:hypothetical protein [SAR324 cluster bacterium]